MPTLRKTPRRMLLAVWMNCKPHAGRSMPLRKKSLPSLNPVFCSCSAKRLWAPEDKKVVAPWRLSWVGTQTCPPALMQSSYNRNRLYAAKTLKCNRSRWRPSISCARSSVPVMKATLMANKNTRWICRGWLSNMALQFPSWLGTSSRLPAHWLAVWVLPRLTQRQRSMPPP